MQFSEGMQIIFSQASLLQGCRSFSISQRTAEVKKIYFGGQKDVFWSRFHFTFRSYKRKQIVLKHGYLQNDATQSQGKGKNIKIGA